MAFNPSFPYLQERNASDFDFQNYCKILQNAWSSTWPYKNFIFCNNIFASWGKIPFCFQGAVAVKRRLLENVCSWRSAGWGSGTNYHSPRWSSRPILHARYFEKKSPAWRKPETLGRIPGVILYVGSWDDDTSSHLLCLSASVITSINMNICDHVLRNSKHHPKIRGLWFCSWSALWCSLGQNLPNRPITWWLLMDKSLAPVDRYFFSVS